MFTFFLKKKKQTEMRGDGDTGNGCSHLADTQRQEVGSGYAAKCTKLVDFCSSRDFFGLLSQCSLAQSGL